MVKYIRVVLFSLAALVGVTAVSYVTTNRLAQLKQEKREGGVEVVSLKERERQLKCMTQNIYWEAGSEPAEGKLAVAQVVMNRAASGRYPTDLCQVIYQRNIFYEKIVCQFSWYCENASHTRPIHQKLWDESQDAAKAVILEGFRLPALKDALYYHADYTNPNWNKERVAKIGRHIFYKDRI